MALSVPTTMVYKASCCARMSLRIQVFLVLLLFVVAAGMYAIFWSAFKDVKPA